MNEKWQHLGFCLNHEYKHQKPEFFSRAGNMFCTFGKLSVLLTSDPGIKGVVGFSIS